MGTGVSPKRIATGNFLPWQIQDSTVYKTLTTLTRLGKTSSSVRVGFRTKLGKTSLSTQCLLLLFLRKEVIQPHLPIRLPCYDFTPIIYPTLGGWLQKVTSPTSGVTNSRGVTGGVYKARERIHRGVLIRDY